MTNAMLLFAIAGLLSGLLLGWDLAVYNHRRTRRLLETSIADLEAQVASFQDDLDRDPQRAWIDMGKRNVINQMEATLRIIRETLQPQEPHS